MSAPIQIFLTYGIVAVASGLGYFLGGQNPTTLTSVQIYDMSNDSVSAGTALGTARTDGGNGAANNSFGIIAGGNTAANTTEKRTFSGDTTAAGTNLGYGVNNSSAGSSTTIFYLMGGLVTGTASVNTDKYTYSSDVVAGGTNLQTALAQGTAGFYTTTKAYATGLNTNLNKLGIYTYSGDTTANGTAMSTPNTQEGAGLNTITTGYYEGGFDVDGSTVVATGKKYSIAGGTWSSGTNLTAARWFPRGAGNTTIGIIAAGYDATFINQLNTYKYTFSGDTIGAGTSISTARDDHFGFSSYHGGLN